MPPPRGTKEYHAFMARYRYARQKSGLLGPLDRVPVDDARTVILQLREAGFTNRRIGDVLGVDRKYVGILLEPGRTHISKMLHDKITSHNVWQIICNEVPSLARVPAHPYRERLRRHMAAGWTRDEMIARCEHLHDDSNLWRDRAKYIRPHVARALDRLFEELGDGLGPKPNGATALRLRRRGYGPPAAYDENDVLSPGMVPPTPAPRMHYRMKIRKTPPQVDMGKVS